MHNHNIVMRNLKHTRDISQTNPSVFFQRPKVMKVTKDLGRVIDWRGPRRCENQMHC